MKFTVEEMLTKVPLPATEKWPGGVWDVELFQRAGVKLIFFSPKGVDHQTTHEEDEFYFIVRGSGQIVIDGEIHSFSAGDVFFVEKHVTHRFEKFTDDFATWAIFF
jgi:mannose-6-phosphate isomerase-like protein (cupin superfamily)